MTRPLILNTAWLPDGRFEHWVKAFPECEFIDARSEHVLDRHLGEAIIFYGVPALSKLAAASQVRWIQLISAGVPRDLCPPAKGRNLTVTNLAGLYGPSIAEHALAMMLILSRNLQVAIRQQQERRWERSLARTMVDLHGKTLAVVGLGNIGQNIARLARSFGMRVVGSRRSPRPMHFVDQVVAPSDLRGIFPEADYVAVAAPLTDQTEGMLGPDEFRAMKRGVIYINMSRGPIAQEQALLAALQSGQVAAAGLDVFAVEPLAVDHPFWTMPHVLVSPHYSGETVNQSGLPAERFARNLRSWLGGRELEGLVKLELGY